MSETEEPERKRPKTMQSEKEDRSCAHDQVRDLQFWRFLAVLGDILRICANRLG